MKYLSYGYGLLLCVAIGVAAILLSSFIPFGAVALAILVGILVGNIAKPGGVFASGITFCEKNLLSVAIALMGVRLDFLILEKLGFKSIFLVVAALASTITIAIVLSKIFSFDKKFALLLGIGNGVCGSSAIAATEAIIGANEEEVGLSVAIVNFLGTIGIFLAPFLATVVLKFTDINSGVFIGNTLQAVGQVVAAGFSVSDDAGQIATIVKMTRILMLFPLVFILIFLFKSKCQEGSTKVKKPTIPLFIVGFIVFSLISTFKVLPENMIGYLSKIGHYSLIIAMSGIGLKITFKSILRDGKSALTIGALIFLSQLIFSAVMVSLLF